MPVLPLFPEPALQDLLAMLTQALQLQTIGNSGDGVFLCAPVWLPLLKSM